MKIKPEHLAAMKEAISPLDTAERRQAYRDGNFPRADKVKDLNKRYRWDLLWAADFTRLIIASDVYTYANDTHIDTALRSIVPKLD